MKELTLADIKQRELEILKSFKSYCDEHHIRFVLSNGTLLGAVKYCGFIPWDDDVDVLVLREDYDRLMREFPSDHRFTLLCAERDHEYVFPFAKLSDMTTRITNQTVLKGYRCGVHIDIFPIDYWSDDMSQARRQARSIRQGCQNLGLSIAAFSKGRSVLRTCAKTLLIARFRLKGYRRVRAKLMEEIESARREAGTAFCGCLVWPIYGEREIHPASVFADAVTVEFEGETFPAPVGYDAYLRRMYGDYEQDPPPEKQKSHHRFRAYEMGEEQL